MSENILSDEARKRIGQFLNGESSDEDREALEGLLIGNPEAQALFLEYCQLHIDLSVDVWAEDASLSFLAELTNVPKSTIPESTSEGTPASPVISQFIQDIQPNALAPSIEASRQSNGSERSPASPFFASRMYGVGLAVVASLLIAASVLYWPKDEGPSVAEEMATVGSEADDLYRIVRHPFHVASLVEVENVVWEPGQDFQLGCFFSEGDSLHLKEGTAQISMVSGADVVLQAPCSIQLVNERIVQLNKGKLTAQVAEWATGFVVETQGLRVTDLGTRFAVSAESPDSAEVHVMQGSVLAEPQYLQKKKDAKLLLVSGEAIRVGKQTARLNHLAADRENFVDELDNFRPFRAIDMPNTGRGFEIDAEDSRWRIINGDSKLGPWPQPAFVNAPHPRYSDDTPEKSQWISFSKGTTEGVLNYARKNKIITFETTFDLAGFDPETVHITAQILADNGVQQIRLNGTPIVMTPWADDRYRQMFCLFREVQINSGFVDGVNRIEIDVVNLPIRPRKKIQLNPAALRVEWLAFGVPLNEI